ncbi:MAG: transcription termination factor Rho [Gemmatimonadaceae bacterium]|nr:transcription termination factor Rho [Gemmatimonadaceae bacterium]
MAIADLRRLALPDLVRWAEVLQVENADILGRAELLARLQRAMLRNGQPLIASGVLEIVKEGHGFLRSQDWSYLASPDDVYVSPSQIKRFDLRTGDLLSGDVRNPKPWEKFVGLSRVHAVNGNAPDESRKRPQFDHLRPVYPDSRIRLEDGDLSMRVVDLLSPIGKGQRGLIVAPPRVGKTILLHKMANAILKNHPEVTLIILLIDERPEEVTDFRESCPGAEVVASTFDEPAKRHVAVAEMVAERARRLVEEGQDVVILLDSITRLGRAYNTLAPSRGRIMSGGVESTALQRPKRFFGSARRCADGGSLTIVATALIETGSRMDEVIFEEFKGTGNMELVLSRAIANRRIYPAVDIGKSGTRREDLLFDETERNRIFLLRHFLGGMDEEAGIKFLVDRLKRTKDNREFFISMQE